MRAAFVALLLLALAVALAAAGNLITDGYVADGRTTYCKMADDDPFADVFRTVDARSADKCPLSLSMSVSVRSYTMETVIFDVTWSVSLSPNSSDVVYPATARADGQVPLIVPTIQGCLVESNCETLTDLIIPKRIGNRSAGMLNTSSRAAVVLESYEFELPASDDFVIVGNAAVSNRNGLVENLVFQKVRTASDGSTLPGTIRPPAPGFANPTPSPAPSTVRLIPTLPGAATPEPSTPPPASIAPAPLTQPPILLTPPPSKLDPLNGQTTVTASSGASHGNALNALVVAGIAVVGIAIAAVVAMIKNRREGAIGSPPRAESMRLPRSNHRRYPVGGGDTVSDELPTLEGTRSDRTGGGFVVLDTIRESFVLLQSVPNIVPGQDHAGGEAKEDDRHRREDAEKYRF